MHTQGSKNIENIFDVFIYACKTKTNCHTVNKELTFSILSSSLIK